MTGWVCLIQGRIGREPENVRVSSILMCDSLLSESHILFLHLFSIWEGESSVCWLT